MGIKAVGVTLFLLIIGRAVLSPRGTRRLARRSLPPLAVLLLSAIANLQAHAQSVDREGGHRHQIETYPIMALFGVYSVQYSYHLSARNEIIVGLAYVNVDVNDRDGNVVGRMHAPTLPVGFRRYLWKNAHVEYQLWPAYNNYYDRTAERYHPGFDLYNEVRAGYRVDFRLGGVPLFTNLQYVYGFGLYPGNKPESFHQAIEDAPPFHVPSISIGVRF